MKLYFNDNLIPSKYKEIPKYNNLVKLVLYIIKEEIEVRNILIWKMVTSGMTISIDFSEDIVEELQEITLELEKLGVIRKNYEKTKLIRWVLERPLYVKKLINSDISKETINLIRSYFLKSYCGESNRNAPEDLVQLHLKIWLENNYEIELEKIIPVFKYVVDLNPSYTPNILKLIDNKGEYPTKNLLSYYEEYKESGTTTGNFVN